jgi:peptidoglycan/LPS O-acetylase OafA/YrhL
MQVGIPISIVVAITISQEHYFKLNKWLINLGDWSYSTYLCHVLILSIGFRLMTIWDLNIWIVLIICCLSIYVLSWASYIFVEQAANRLIKNNFVASQRRGYIVNTLI